MKVASNCADVRPPEPVRSGRPFRQDYEYERRGGANLFLFTEPLRGWRQVWVTQRHTAVDVADALRRLVDECYPDAERIVLVSDNLNVHLAASLTPRLHRPKRAAWPANWSGITRRSMPVG